MGYTFRKEFHSGWFTGTVKQIRPLAKGDKDRRCVYDDGDSEDLSLIELQTLAKLDPNVTKQKPAIGVSSSASSKGKAAKAKVAAAEAARIAEEMRPRVSGLNEVPTPPPKKQVVRGKYVTMEGTTPRFKHQQAGYKQSPVLIFSSNSGTLAAVKKHKTLMQQNNAPKKVRLVDSNIKDAANETEDKENQINIGCGSAPGGFGNSNQPMDATQQPQHLLLLFAKVAVGRIINQAYLDASLDNESIPQQEVVP
jgi:hypothetical protein